MILKKKKENKKFLMAILAISIVAVMFIPMLYSSIYLGAFWDPYGRLDNVPVAFVNMDKPVTKDGKEYAVGKELEDNLKDNDKVAWKFVSYNEAKKGVEGTSYYAMIEIPENFSEKIADCQDGKINSPEVIYEANKGRNFVFSQISERVAESIKAEVSSNIQKEISKALIDSLYDIKISIKDAGDGTGKLQDGTEKLFDGSKKIVDGIGQAANGSIQLENGLKQAGDGAGSLQNGAQNLFDGSVSLSSGLGTAVSGSKQLYDGLKVLAKGESQVADGSGALVNGLNDFKSNLVKSDDKIPVLVKGASEVSNNTVFIEQGAEKLNTSLNTGLNGLADGVNQVANSISQADLILNEESANIENSNLSEIDKAKLRAAISAIHKINGSDISGNIEKPLRSAANSAQPLVDNLKKLKEGTKQVSEGVGQLANGLADTQSKAAVGLDQLINGAKGVQSGSNNILAGLNTVRDKTGELSKGLNQLDSGSISLKDGLKSVNDGTLSLKEGLNTAALKTGELSEGLKQLSDGSVSLNNGLKDANDGALKLKDGLNSGYDKINSSVKFNSEDMSKFISQPITLKDNSINNVKYYGEGLAPYFVSLSLWLGAMFINLILSISKLIDVVKNKFLKSFLGKFISGSVMAVLQSLILSFVLVKVLKIEATSITNFYLTNMFVSVVFFSVMYGVSYAIGVMGTPIMFIVFLLQLSSSGGTFPIETAPQFYRVVGRFVPMTYSINTLRMIISGTNSPVLYKNIIVMLIFMVLFLGGGFVFKSVSNLIKKENKFFKNLKVS